MFRRIVLPLYVRLAAAGAAIAACGGGDAAAPKQTPARIAFSMQPTNATAGSAFTVTVEIQDTAGVAVAGATNTVTLALTNNANGATLSGATSVNAVGGVATFANVGMTLAGTGYALVASSSGFTNATSGAFNILPGLPAKLVFNGPAPNKEAAEPFTGTQVYVTDEFSNTVPTATNSITLALQSPTNGAVLSGNTTANAVSGVASFNVLTVDRPGTFQLSATAASLSTALSQPFNVQLHLDDISAGGTVGTAAAGQHTCGNKHVYSPVTSTTWVAFCWGANESGQLGDGGNSQRNAPTPVTGFWFPKITAGGSHTCALDQNGYAYCWGKNSSGQLGDGTATNRNVPTAVSGGRTYVDISAGDEYTCAVSTPNAWAYCWGLNQYGQLGDGTTTSRSVPTLAPTSGLAAIRAGTKHTCAVAYGGAYCWGANESGEIGDGTTTQRESPTPVGPGRAFQFIEPGVFHTCGFTSDLTAYCWGSNSNSQLGNGTAGGPFTLTPTAMNTSLSLSGVSSGWWYGCARAAVNPTQSINAYCWGYNDDGQLGDGTSGTSRNNPVLVQGVTNVTVIDAGVLHTCALTDQRVVYCWGANAKGQLGVGTTTPHTSAVRVAP